jgi:ABC-2 type transport system permease protein/oleandomycin transport system permease protein
VKPVGAASAGAVDASEDAQAPRRARPPRGILVGDSLAIVWRNLLTIRRNPQLLVFATVQPVIFVVMFRYVFGGAIEGSLPAGQTYINYLMPGVFVQTIVFGALTTGVGLADDLGTGLVDRFRSLPMARSAVLIGRTGADLVRNFFVVTLMCVVGILVGWTIETDIAGFLGAFLLILAFAYAMSWVFAIVGLSVRDGETAQAVSFPMLALLVFASSAFVPVATMPSWLQVWARNQPVSVVINATRYLTIGASAGTNAASVPKAIAWIVGIIAVAAPVAVARYRKAV